MAPVARAAHGHAGASNSHQLFLYSTTVSDVGTVRSNNQDSSFAGERLIAICDGMGGHAGGDTASTIAIRSLAHIEQSNAKSDVASIASMMETSVMAAHDAIVGKAKRERGLAGMGTTVTAVALVSGHWVITHIGDSRAYLLRDGKIRRMTQDHSYVQHLIDTGRITEAEARNHPQRNVVMRVLGDFDIDPHPDIAVFRALPGDRWLLCSDGLSGVLEDDTLEQMLVTVSDEEECAQQLVAMALKAGSTDNVTAVIADATLALDADSFDLPHQTPLIGGAASSNLEAIADIIKEPVASSPMLRLGKQSPAQRAAALTHGGYGEDDDENDGGQYPPDAENPVSPDTNEANGDEASATGGQKNHHHRIGHPDNAAQADTEDDGDTGNIIHVAQPSAVRDENDDKANMDTGEIPVVKKKDGRVSADPNDPEVARAIRREHQRRRKEERRKHNRARTAIILAFVIALCALLGVGFGAYRWSQSKYYVGTSDDTVAIYQGVNTNLFSLPLSHKVESTDIELANLPQSWNDALNEGIAVDSLEEAKSHVTMIRKEAKTLQTSKKKNPPLPWEPVAPVMVRPNSDKPDDADTEAVQPVDVSTTVDGASLAAIPTTASAEAASA
ncbi:PP2C family serine/threonine-protein phosphatase [Bifidobacterium sp. ESL0732]|uniref:PP2C family protein-serine/threonine phosphatase n=1 Tax=Bifidobacterium sp. ESL0732 TaxID=2983222 RepID=UPI0023F94528|nr:PP2C family serine/threonine-protein phosphatase [Bifidobacterium sp. ESL0732]WEV64982.1 protein phosphatase 2C domain-containing protein [Bifidobacterium sp. ESL0732]